MKKKVGILFISIAILATGTLSAQKLNKVLKNHFKMVGQENLVKVNSIIMKGSVYTQGMEFPLTLVLKRPASVRTEVDVQGQLMVTAYDGKNGWTINPMMGWSEPQDLEPAQVKEMKIMGDIDGELYDYKKKGSSLELLGTESIDDTECFKLKLTREEGDSSIFYMDSESYFIIKTETEMDVQGVKTLVEQYPGNYKIIDDIAFPFSINQSYAGQTYMEITMDSVELNPEIADSLFIKPSQ
ncbi:MAG: hypothetical protein JSV24_10735 [Bacteroidales bacterium]|nr:MAG: hypothetical protein JSV24_10735 [Bacteroidales bacterium]